MATSSENYNMSQSPNHLNWFPEPGSEFTVHKWPDLNSTEHLWDVMEQEILIVDV